MTGTKWKDPVDSRAHFAGRKIADVPGGDLLIKDGQQGRRNFSGRRGSAVVIPIGSFDGQMNDLTFYVLDTAVPGIAQTKKFDGIVVQPFQHISVMDVADL